MILTNISLGIYAVSAVAIALYALVLYGILSPAGVIELGARVAPSIKETFQTEKPSIYLHATFSGVALILSPFQIIPYFRKRNVDAHRWIGRVYIFSVFIGSVTGMIVATKAYGGIATQVAFGILAVLWFWTTLTGFIGVMLKRLNIHRRAMFYSCALSFSAVTLRAWLGLGLAITSGNFPLVYPIAAWLCWVPNLPLAELILRYGQRKSADDRPAL